MSKILIVEARFYEDISDMLFEGATAKIDASEHDYEVIDVAGALEIPAAISYAATQQKYAGFLALGCVIRGETYHFEIVSGESARALMDLSLKMPIGNGILTTENHEQAVKRADPTVLNKGGEAAFALLKQIELKEKFS